MATNRLFKTNFYLYSQQVNFNFKTLIAASDSVGSIAIVAEDQAGKPKYFGWSRNLVMLLYNY